MKRAWNLSPVPQLFKRYLKNIALAYIYQLAKFGVLMSCGSKDIFKNATCPMYHHEVTDLVNHGMVKNTKTWMSSERNITFLRNKKILNPCLRWHILRSYHFAKEVTFKSHLFLKIQHDFFFFFNWVDLVLDDHLRSLSRFFINSRKSSSYTTFTTINYNSNFI